VNRLRAKTRNGVADVRGEALLRRQGVACQRVHDGLGLAADLLDLVVHRRVAPPEPSALDPRFAPVLGIQDDHARRADQQGVDVAVAARPLPVDQEPPLGLAEVDDDALNGCRDRGLARRSGMTLLSAALQLDLGKGQQVLLLAYERELLLVLLGLLVHRPQRCDGHAGPVRIPRSSEVIGPISAVLDHPRAARARFVRFANAEGAQSPRGQGGA